MAPICPSKEWMNARLLSNEYIEGAKSFIKFTQLCLGEKVDWYCCPCLICRLNVKNTAETIYEHIICNGIDTSYTRWIYHGESFPKNRATNRVSKNCNPRKESRQSRLGAMVNDVFGRSHPDNLEACLDEVEDNGCAQFVDESEVGVQNDLEKNTTNDPKEDIRYKKLMEDALQPLYPSCEEEDTKLSAVIELLSMKAKARWSDDSFTTLLSFLRRILPKNNVIPEKTSSAKSMIKSLRMKCEIIHACKNDCILYWGVHKDHEVCPTCHESRWQPVDESKLNVKLKPWKKLRYFPLTERLQKMYSIPWIAENMTWHANSVENDTHMRHPVDSSCWKKANRKWKDFAKEKRNVRLGLATDGFNPFGNKSNSYSCWPVMIVPYNLPPSLCLRKEFVMLTLLIPGPSGPGHNIDVYLQPLIEELKLLWSEGVRTYDSFTKRPFTMKAMLLWTIHDYPAYSHVSGCRTAGRYACPVCGEGIDSVWLKFGGKFSYMGCRKFLTDPNHQFRFQKSQFNGKEEHGTHPQRLSGSEVLRNMRKIQTLFGKRPAGDQSLPWSKCSIFFELEYWEHLVIRHNLDVMHVEKNVAETLIATIMNTDGKTKDGMKARKDLQAMKFRRNLWPIKNKGLLSQAKLPIKMKSRKAPKGSSSSKKKNLPYREANFCLSRSERETLCKTLYRLKVPIGYSANWKYNVNLKDFQLKNLKSHDYHVLIQQLLPVLLMHAFKKQKPLREAIRQLSLFFNVLCSKVICRRELEIMGERVVESLCVFEKYFPPSFFVSMVHVVLHLGEEALECGPVRYRWMYLFERMMKTYKGYVGNQTFPEGCITEQYLNDEAMRYCIEYIPSKQRETNGRGWGMALKDDMEHAHPIDKKGKDYMLSTLQYQQARKWLIKSVDENAEWERKYQAYVNEFQPKGKRKRSNSSTEREMEYIPWLRKKLEYKELSTFKRLVDGPSLCAKSYKSYAVNGYVFSTYGAEVDATTQNSGVSVKALTSFRASAKDTNLVEDEAIYYGIVKQILELDYFEFKKVVFYCDWVRIEDKRNGCVIDPDTDLVFVNLGRLQKHDKEDNEPFILASEATQVFYCKDMTRNDWHVVLDSPKRLNADVDVFEDPLVFEARTRRDNISNLLDDVI